MDERHTLRRMQERIDQLKPDEPKNRWEIKDTYDHMVARYAVLDDDLTQSDARYLLDATQYLDPARNEQVATVLKSYVRGVDLHPVEEDSAHTYTWDEVRTGAERILTYNLPDDWKDRLFQHRIRLGLEHLDA